MGLAEVPQPRADRENTVANLKLFKLLIAESPREPLSSFAISCHTLSGSVVTRAPGCGRDLLLLVPI